MPRSCKACPPKVERSVWSHTRSSASETPCPTPTQSVTNARLPPVFTAREFEEMGYRIVIWPASAMRVAAKAQEELYAAIKRDGGTHNMLGRMQTRKELYATIGYSDYERLDASIVESVPPEGQQR